ncbi:MAG: aminotransferase class I/II-fold pyridoxal phosphate-dependent enzyme [Caldilineaceae bacterium]|nr:aminotransferase class I/II-fold pyridoxal phosphate-dependent enzyme [Caldilineaceae bacterium]
MTQKTAPGQIVTPDELRAVAADGTKLRYALMELAGQIPDAITLGRGDPDLDTPAHVIAAARAAILDGRADLPLPVAGLLPLREAVAENLRRQNGVPVQREDILITDGGQEALYLLMQALLDPGDEILVPDPRYTSYDEAIHQAGAKMVLVPTYPEDNFDLRAAEVEAAITPKTKAILIISPSNPTSAVVSPANLRAIAEIAQRHNLVVISDEIYEKFVYPPAQQISVASLPGMYERTVTLGGFSKTYAMTGWRVGYVAAPADFIATLTAVKAATTGPLSAVSQYAALAAATGPQDVVAEYREIYRRRIQLMKNGLRDLGFTFGEPQGAFFVYTNAASSGLAAFELSYLLLKEGHVLIFPGTAFGEKWVDWLRVSVLQPEDQLTLALERMAGVLARHR